ncbi:hypothetical protein B0W81_03040 [Prochlorococcus sp. HOT_208_60]|nr:hypothetical protein B0W81_03040 [Prochlorococcus sp. HOT_208_60]
MKNNVIPLRKGGQKIKNYEVICEILNSFLPLEKKVLILHLGLFENESHTDFEMAKLLNESKDDIHKARETGLRKLRKKINLISHL